MARHLPNAGFDPLGRRTGETGLARLRFERPDVCVLDLMLPRARRLGADRDGARRGDRHADRRRQRARHRAGPRARARARRRRLPRQAVLDAGAGRPRPRGRAPRRSRAGGRRAARRSRSRSCGSTRAASRRTSTGRASSLTPTEFRLLYALALEHGRVVTRDELLQRIWGRRRRRRDRTVDVFVRKLREKIDRARAAHTRSSTRATASATSSKPHAEVVAPAGRPRRERADAAPQPRALVARLQRPRARARRGPDGAAARAGQVLLDLLVEPRRVLHGARRRPAGPGALGRRASARPTAGRRSEALAEIRERVIELTARQARLWRRELRPALAERGHRGRRRRRLHRQGARRARRALRARDLPGADAARRRARASRSRTSRRSRSSLGVFVRDPETRRGAVRPRQGARAAAALPAGRRRGVCPPARARDRALPPLALPADGDRRVRGRSASRATPTSRSPTRRTTCSRRSSSSCAGAASASRAPRGLRADVGRRCVDRLKRASASTTSRCTTSAGCSTSRTRRSSRALDRPDLKDEPWLPVHAAAASRRDRRARPSSSPRSGAATMLVHHPYESFATSVRGVRPRAPRQDPDVIGAEDDRLPDERRVAARAGADRGGRGRASRASASSS